MTKRICEWVLCFGLLLVVTAAWSAESPWFTRSLVGMEVGPTGAQFGNSDTNDLRYCAKFDGREIVRKCAAAHCEYVVLWARDGDFAYYDSKLLLKAPGLALLERRWRIVVIGQDKAPGAETSRGESGAG